MECFETQNTFSQNNLNFYVKLLLSIFYKVGKKILHTKLFYCMQMQYNCRWDF